MENRKCKFSIMIASALAFLIAGWLPAVAGAAGDSQLVVDAGWLSAHSGKVVVVDVRDSKDYLKGHIPGSINIPVNDLQTKPDAIVFPVPSEEKILGGKGLEIDSDVVLVGAGREIAYLEFWMLDYLGMSRVHVLNGGIEEWKGSLETQGNTLAPKVFKARPVPSVYAETEYVRTHLRKPGMVMLDVRSPGEYAGTDVRALRGGHIPGAVNMNYTENFETDSTLLKPIDALQKLYGQLDMKKEYVTYCQTGTRAANSYFVLKALGFQKVRVYDASWVEWGSNESLPVDDVSYLNFVPLLQSVSKLQKEVQELEKKQGGSGQ